MKIGIFADVYDPQINGVTTSIRMLRSGLIRQGHEVYVFTTSNPRAPKVEPGVFRIPSVPFVSANRIGLLYHPKVARVVRNIGLDVVHTHTEFSLGVFGRHLAKTLDLPHVHTMHTKYEDYTHYLVKIGMLKPMAKSVARKISGAFCNCADAVIVPTEKCRDMLLDYGVTRDISVVPTGIELKRFTRPLEENTGEVRSELGLKSDDKVIIYVGRISEEKSIDEVFIALKDYLTANRNVKLVLIGDGPDRERLQALAEQLGIAPMIIFAGSRKWDNIGAYYRAGDVFVSASQSETQGITYLEALASGVPVVAKDDPCIQGIVENGVNGYRIGCMDDLTEYVNKILSQKFLRENLSRGAQATAARYSVDSYTQGVLTTYNLALWKSLPNYA